MSPVQSCTTTTTSTPDIQFEYMVQTLFARAREMSRVMHTVARWVHLTTSIQFEGRVHRPTIPRLLSESRGLHARKAMNQSCIAVAYRVHWTKSIQFEGRVHRPPIPRLLSESRGLHARQVRARQVHARQVHARQAMNRIATPVHRIG